MKTVRLIYYSRASREMSLADLKSILESARRNNSELEVCGMLCYDKLYFLQALEGDRETVNELYLDIADDHRHDQVTIISYDEVESPTFGEWQMGYAGGSAAFKTLLKDLGQDDFDPSALSPDECFKLLSLMSGAQSDV
jgi:hypothetical protein